MSPLMARAIAYSQLAPAGQLTLDPLVVNNMAKQFPAILSLRVTAMNVYGKVYVTDKVLGLVP